MEKNEKTNRFKLNPLQLLLLVAGIIWFVVLAGTVYNLPDIPKTPKEEIQRVIYKDTLSIPDIEFNEGKMIPGVQLANIIAPNEKLLTMGAASFKSSCASCHGEQGKGDGVAGKMLNPKPRNFHEKTGWKNGREISGMFKTLQEGIAGSGMSAYEFLPAEELFAIIYYVRSFTNDFPPVTEDELIAIDNIYDITRDKKAGAQIPVSLAKDKVIKVHQIDIDKIINQIEKSQSTTLALFNKVTNDKRKAVQTLSVNKEWQSNTKILMNIMTANLIENGFKANATRLSAEQLTELQTFLKAVIV